MNIKQIRELARIVSEAGLTSLEVNEGDVRVVVKRELAHAPAPNLPQPWAMPSGPAQPAALPASEAMGSTVDFNRTFEVTSPLVGVFYAAASPGAQPFVKVGSRVRKGDALCIVEAMKLMNEITADRDGEVVDICVNDGEVVEFGQTLFKLC